MRAIIIATTFMLATIGSALAVGYVECGILGSYPTRTIIVPGNSCPAGTYFIQFV